ncbi:hypothetical protein BDR04DRAFT_1128440 [Suillus decipiens]|nr:hypothetical protein BDR04DRAFT_1128440 [Suillus decipiens]
MILLLCTVLFCIPNSPPHNTRTLWDILSSCGLTLFACTWTAVHPDIPNIDQGIINITFCRLSLMVMVLIAPESMICWAILQCFKWTWTHGFFACMGGFVLYVDDQPWGTLTPKELLQFIRDRSVDMPVITEADIQDRSKGDVLSKCVAILQLVWFLIQIIARYAQNLPVTPLEIDTLSVAALACISYALWIKKPKDIRRPYIVHWKSEVAAPPRDRFVDE